ncbi:membrane-anchored junction protein isoform X2 [Piliocolobus tephrosceles]|uniref:membrane-anchored junction protein isoform X2 n=1 Tax=Piliocolobus tephrosceles TaxID=591936 RepID=UPI000E6B3F72|nr:membrane-anchored junction protein isoform X2 [Piliocolobus tephrosceles]
MSLKPFTYPFPETRFLHAGPNVYKFKIRYGNSIRILSVWSWETWTIFSPLLQNTSLYFPHHFPDKSKWERVSHLKFKHGEIILIPYPFVLTLYVEMKWFHENLSPGKPISDSPLGLVPAEKKAVGAVMRKRKHMDEPSSPSRPGLDRAKIGTSSPGSSKKKPPMETRRTSLKILGDHKRLHCLMRRLFPGSENRERKTQQGLQETLASDITGVQKQDSEWGHSLPGPVVPPLQHNSPPPKERAASGFVGFLSSLFPFRYFFRKSSHS